MRLLFIRHAESEKNIGEKFDKSDDQKDKLTSKGEKDIIAMAKYLNKFISKSTSSIFITGNRRRAIESTQKISEYLSFEYQIDNELIPINPGLLSGLSYNESFEKFPELMKKRKLFTQNIISGYDLVFPEGDLFNNYEEGIKNWVEKYIYENQTVETIFVITHRSVILAVLNIFNKILGNQETNIYKYYSTPNGFIVEIELNSKTPINLISHGGIDEWGKDVSSDFSQFNCPK